MSTQIESHRIDRKQLLMYLVLLQTVFPTRIIWSFILSMLFWQLWEKQCIYSAMLLFWIYIYIIGNKFIHLTVTGWSLILPMQNKHEKKQHKKRKLENIFYVMSLKPTKGDFLWFYTANCSMLSNSWSHFSSCTQQTTLMRTLPPPTVEHKHYMS